MWRAPPGVPRRQSCRRMAILSPVLKTPPPPAHSSAHPSTHSHSARSPANPQDKSGTPPPPSPSSHASKRPRPTPPPPAEDNKQAPNNATCAASSMHFRASSNPSRPSPPPPECDPSIPPAPPSAPPEACASRLLRTSRTSRPSIELLPKPPPHSLSMHKPAPSPNASTPALADDRKPAAISHPESRPNSPTAPSPASVQTSLADVPKNSRRPAPAPADFP